MKTALTSQSTWGIEEIESYLQAAHTPIRLAVNDGEDFPLICSMWFHYEAGCFWCAAHQSSRLISALQNKPMCSFEVSGNEIPYCGVRGRGSVTLHADTAESVLSGLINRYLGNTNGALADWLLSRSSEEYAIRIEPTRMNAWDFSHRMSPVNPS